MKKSVIFFVVSCFCFGLITQNSIADINVGLSVGDEGIKEFHLTIGSHFGVHAKNVEKIKERSISDEELVVVFFLAQKANVEPTLIVDLRLKGNSWMTISTKLGLSTEIFYVHFVENPGPPYGKAYGHYKNKPKNSWHKINLDDNDIVNIINLKFITSRYGCTVEEIVKLRKRNKSYVSINSNLKKGKRQKEYTNKTSDQNQSKSKGKSIKGKSKKK